MLIPWNKLPDNMKNAEVKKYYAVLVKRRTSLAVKRGFDILFSFFLLIILSWLFVILAVMIKVDSQGPVFFRQTRVTTGNRDFRIFKFRTMVNNADKMGTLVTVDNDARITKIGSKIRKYRLDEIPQLINVLRGEMTFVGTRPEVRKYVEQYTDEMMATLLLPAGITSLASISYRHEDDFIAKYIADGMTADDAYVKKILPEKMKYNIRYLKDFNFFYDMSLMISTVLSVVK